MNAKIQTNNKQYFKNGKFNGLDFDKYYFCLLWQVLLVVNLIHIFILTMSPHMMDLNFALVLLVIEIIKNYSDTKI